MAEGLCSQRPDCHTKLPVGSLVALDECYFRLFHRSRLLDFSALVELLKIKAFLLATTSNIRIDLLVEELVN